MCSWDRTYPDLAELWMTRSFRLADSRKNQSLAINKIFDVGHALFNMQQQIYQSLCMAWLGLMLHLVHEGIRLKAQFRENRLSYF